MNICHDELRPPNYDNNLIGAETGSIQSDDKAIMGLRGLLELGGQFAADFLLINQIPQNSLSGYNITTNYHVCSCRITLESGWQQKLYFHQICLKMENGQFNGPLIRAPIIITNMD